MASQLSLFPQTMSLAVHELRTPVTVVAGYLRMVLREHAGPLTEKQRTMLEEADRSCTRIDEIVSEMSDLGKLESKELTLAATDMDLAALVVDLARSMQEGDDRGVRLDVRGADRPLMVAGDRPRLAAALSALMHATVREWGDSGAIVVECATMTDINQTWAVVAMGEEAVVRSLIDAARATPPVFDEWRSGLGLALPIGKRVIERHGGALWSAATNARAGSALRLPLRRPEDRR